MHVLEYGLLSYLVGRGFRQGKPGSGQHLRTYLKSLPLLLLVSVLDERVQDLLPNRTADPRDILLTCIVWSPTAASARRAPSTIRPDEKTRIFVNPDGPFIVGGPSAHSGLTGRKNAIDTYGEYSRHSGAALSGKDPTRIDRIGAYAARYAAKNVVAAGLAGECEVQLSYSMGLSRPVSVQSLP